MAFGTEAVCFSASKHFPWFRTMCTCMLWSCPGSLGSWSCWPLQLHLSSHVASTGHTAIPAIVVLPCPTHALLSPNELHMLLPQLRRSPSSLTLFHMVIITLLSKYASTTHPRMLYVSLLCAPTDSCIYLLPLQTLSYCTDTIYLFTAFPLAVTCWVLIISQALDQVFYVQ